MATWPEILRYYVCFVDYINKSDYHKQSTVQVSHTSQLETTEGKKNLDVTFSWKMNNS